MVAERKEGVEREDDLRNKVFNEQLKFFF